ncbi:hypothetical protein CALCODRAFT_357442 [Calocera cornea HHB12733]|uniref:Uncharacterized protein n=1 Tax=Calocera cornea HHB12733 TaxID=1353952 RepID=A0A165EP82_9BASI|nr:hypothetical protein CALCODRAFT_357442 [Calocera cornea HHB12733]
MLSEPIFAPVFPRLRFLEVDLSSLEGIEVATLLIHPNLGGIEIRDCLYGSILNNVPKPKWFSKLMDFQAKLTEARNLIDFSYAHGHVYSRHDFSAAPIFAHFRNLKAVHFWKLHLDQPIASDLISIPYLS